MMMAVVVVARPMPSSPSLLVVHKIKISTRLGCFVEVFFLCWNHNHLWSAACQRCVNPNIFVLCLLF
jgi:hypothetical protein